MKPACDFDTLMAYHVRTNADGLLINFPTALILGFLIGYRPDAECRTKAASVDLADLLPFDTRCLSMAGCKHWTPVFFLGRLGITPDCIGRPQRRMATGENDYGLHRFTRYRSAVFRLLGFGPDAGNRGCFFGRRHNRYAGHE